MSTDINTKASATTFQYLNGQNFTTTGVDISVPVKNGSVGVYAGIGTEYTAGSTGIIFDVKGSVPYYKDENIQLSAGGRIRNNLTGDSQTVQIRLQPATVTVPVGENTSIYATPYVAEKINYNSGATNTSVGIFGGASFKVGDNTSIFVEGQLYDMGNVNKNTTSLNAGISVKF